VGYNITKALYILGHQVEFLSLIGQDLTGQVVLSALETDGLPHRYVLQSLPSTAQSVIVYDHTGRRSAHTDLKDIQDRTYPADIFEQALAEAEVLALCNVNYNRAFLRSARRSGKLVATDVHNLSDMEDDYNRDFMQTADILFMSDERLPIPPEDWARAIAHRYQNRLVVIGLGAAGALLYERERDALHRIPAVHTRQVVNTIGAGDALFSAFLHSYVKTKDAYQALRKAIVFASYKIGVANASGGFLTAGELESWSAQVYGG
jgi:ribokinase